jgi:hypothetical protein
MRGAEMGKWDEVRERFKADRASAVRRNERSGKELQLVQAKQNDLWESLRNEAKTAVEEINVGERLLTFADADSLQPTGFRIIYYRDKENLEVLARFRPESNVVSINLPHMPSLKKDFDIVADKKNKVGFVAGKVPYSPDEIVSEMLSHLMGEQV